MANWTFTIVSQVGTAYTVSIGGMSAAKTLKGSAVPITIDEDDSDDFFTPVRTQSGVLKFWDETGILWKQLNPAQSKSLPVTITKSSGGSTVTVWRGYVQGQTFSGEFPAFPTTHSIPVICPLGVLEGIKFNPAWPSNGITNIAWALQYILTQAGFSWANLYFPGNTGNVTQRLRARYDIRNFMDAVAETPKYNCLEVLNEICKYFGWQCRTQGEDIYFTSFADSIMRNAGYAVATWTDLTTLAGGTTETLDETSLSFIDLEPEDPLTYADTTGEELLTQGWGSASVEADINAADNIVEIPTEALTEATRFNNVTDQYYLNPGGGGGQEIGVKSILLDKSYTTPGIYQQGDWIIQELDRTTSWLEIAEYYQGPAQYHNQYNMKDPLLCLPSASSLLSLPVGNHGIELRTSAPVTIPPGMLVIAAKTWIDKMTSGSHEQIVDYANIAYTLRIGDWWWDGLYDNRTGRWVYQPSEDVIMATNTGVPGGRSSGYNTGTGQILSNKHLNDGYAYYEGEGARVDNAMTGILRLRIFGFIETPQSGTFIEWQRKLGSLVISHAPLLTGNIENTETRNTYTAANATQYPEKRELTTILATYNNNKNGKAFMFNAAGGYLDGLMYNDSEYIPEQRTADIMAAFGGSHRSQINATLFAADLAGVTPKDGVMFNGGDYCIFSRSLNLWDDTIKIKAIEI